MRREAQGLRAGLIVATAAVVRAWQLPAAGTLLAGRPELSSRYLYTRAPSLRLARGSPLQSRHLRMMTTAGENATPQQILSFWFGEGVWGSPGTARRLAIQQLRVLARRRCCSRRRCLLDGK